MEQITIDRKVIVDLARRMEEIQDRIESLEIASDPEIMASLKRSKEQIKNGKVVDFNEL